MRKRVAQKIRASVIKGLHDGAKEYDPDMMFADPPYLNDFDPFYMIRAYNRAYDNANRKLVRSMTTSERAQAAAAYRRRFMTDAERQQEDLLHEVRDLQSTVVTLQTQVNRLDNA